MSEPEVRPEYPHSILERVTRERAVTARHTWTLKEEESFFPSLTWRGKLHNSLSPAQTNPARREEDPRHSVSHYSCHTVTITMLLCRRLISGLRGTGASRYQWDLPLKIDDGLLLLEAASGVGGVVLKQFSKRKIGRNHEECHRQNCIAAV